MESNNTFLNLFESDPNRNTKMLSLENLVLAIEELESSGTISFEDFKELPYLQIKRRFFAMPKPTQIEKAIIKIEDKRAGKEGLSSHATITEVSKDGKITKTIEKTNYF